LKVFRTKYIQDHTSIHDWIGILSPANFKSETDAEFTVPAAKPEPATGHMPLSSNEELRGNLVPRLKAKT